MRKLRLNHDELLVESFVPSNEGGSSGTVVGRESYPYWGCQSNQATCFNQGCNTGLTRACATGEATDCPGQGQCPPFSEGHTCASTCTDVEDCSFCGAVC